MTESTPARSNSLSDPSEWVDLHGDSLYRFALIRVRNRTVAEEVVHETFLAALQAKDRFSGKSTERTWMIGILRKKIVDHFRKQSRGLTIDDSIEQDALAKFFFDKHGHWKPRIPAWPFGEGESISNQEFWRVLDDCVFKLPEGVANVFTLRDVEGMDTEQVCKVLEITATNLGARLHRARVWLRSCLQENWFSGEVRKGVG